MLPQQINGVADDDPQAGPDQESDEQRWRRFTPEIVSISCCMARTWNGGKGGQCPRPPIPGGAGLCLLHGRDARSAKCLTHGRVDGPIPMAKLWEFEKQPTRTQDAAAMNTEGSAGRQRRRSAPRPAVTPAQPEASVAAAQAAARALQELQQPTLSSLEENTNVLDDRALASSKAASWCPASWRRASSLATLGAAPSVSTSEASAASVVGDVQRTIRAKRPASEISLPEAEREHQAVRVPASKNRVEHAVARRISKKGSAMIDNTRRNHSAAGRPDTSEDMVLKVLKPLNLGLKVKVRNTYTFGELLERCKGQASKIAQLTRLTKDTTFFEQVLAKSDIGDVD